MTNPIDDDDMRPEYDLSKIPTPWVRGKYAERMRHGYSVRINYPDGRVVEKRYPSKVGVVEIDVDLRDQFPDSVSVNQALRSLLKRG